MRLKEPFFGIRHSGLHLIMHLTMFISMIIILLLLPADTSNYHDRNPLPAVHSSLPDFDVYESGVQVSELLFDEVDNSFTGHPIVESGGGGGGTVIKPFRLYTIFMMLFFTHGFCFVSFTFHTYLKSINVFQSHSEFFFKLIGTYMYTGIIIYCVFVG